MAWGRIKSSMWTIPFAVPLEQSSLAEWTILLGNPKDSIEHGGIVLGEEFRFPKRPRLTDHGRLVARAKIWVQWIQYAREIKWNPRSCDDWPKYKELLEIPDKLSDDEIQQWLLKKYLNR